jgi:hypothetical protein
MRRFADLLFADIFLLFADLQFSDTIIFCSLVCNFRKYITFLQFIFRLKMLSIKFKDDFWLLGRFDADYMAFHSLTYISVFNQHTVLT